MSWTLPNALTVARVLAAPLVALAFLLFERPAADRLALALFLAAALTDFLDGWLARRLGQFSAFGQMLDPIADKAMVTIALGVLLAISGPDWRLVLPAVAIFLREVLVSGLREFLGDIKLPVTPLAKWKTASQMVAIGLLFAEPAFGLPAGGGLVLLWLAAILTIVTGADYLRKAMPHLERRES
ncbi:MAG TPA: CDP-diacylglycerol--glycerol-3-phosphate 3-phosphatidyltransferase [Paracoccaceae bacterium]|nr:CDP-diacylglycerol--glycerol-3-phosphate 3-phosphatidyltransferase [Paracoccaceae bacterium]